MIRNSFVVACLSATIVARATLYAQADSTLRPISLEAAITTALEKNPDLETSRLDVEKARARVHEAWGYTLPSVSVNGQYSYAIKKPVFFLPGIFFNLPASQSVPVEIGSTHSLNVGVQASQILFNGAVFIGVGASHTYSDAATEMYNGKRIEITARVRKAYYGDLMAREALALMRQSLANAEDNLRNVRLLRQQGVLSEYDELRATVGIENLRPMVIQAETNAGLASDNLRNTIGLPSTEGVTAEGTLQFQPYDASVLASADETLAEVNPALRALRLQREVSQAFVSAERSNFLPTLVAFGNYMYQAQKDKLTISSNDLIASSSVGLQLSLNLFQGFQTNARIDQAKTEVWKSEAQLTNVENGLRTALRASRGNLETASRRLAAQDKNVEAADRGYKIVTARFLASAATQLEVNDAQLALTQAKVNRIQAIYDYLVASADLDQLLGRVPPCATQTRN